MEKKSQGSEPSAKQLIKLKPDQFDQIIRQVKKELNTTILTWLTIIVLLFGGSLIGIYLSAINQLKGLLVNRISEEFKHPAISKTIKDVAESNAKQIFKDEIQPEVDKFKSEIRCEVDKFEKTINERVDNIANNMQNQLSQEYPIGYTILGYQSGHGIVIHKPFVPPGFKIDWDSTKIEEVTNDAITIKIPDIKSPRFNFLSSKVTLPKKIGQKFGIARGPDWGLFAEIIDIEKDLIVVAVGFEPLPSLSRSQAPN